MARHFHRSAWLRLSIFLLLVFSLAILVSFNGCQKKVTLASVRIGTMGDAVDYSPYMVARSKGWFEEEFKKHGVQNVEYTAFQVLAALNEALGTARVDIVFEAEPPAIIGKTVAPDLKIIGISCTLQQEVLVRTNSSITKVSELRGKKAAVPAGTSSHYNLLKILGAAGLTDKDVEILDLNPEDGRVAFETGQVDAWAIWPPWPEQQIYAKTGRPLPEAQATINSIMSIRGKFQDEHPDIARDAIAVLERARAYILDHPEEAQDLVAKSLKLNPEIIKLAWPKHNWKAQLDKDVIADIQTKTDFLAKRGIIRNTYDVSKELIFPMHAE